MNFARQLRRHLSTWLALSAILVVFGQVAPANAAPIPGMLQGAIFAKALGYDQTVASRGGTPRVIVLASSKGDAHAAKVAEGIRGAKMEAVVLTRSEVIGALAGAAGLYVAAEDFDAELSSLCIKHEVLSLTGSAESARAGRMSVGLDQISGALSLVIHLQRTRSEGHKLSSRLLALAEVIR